MRSKNKAAKLHGNFSSSHRYPTNTGRRSPGVFDNTVISLGTKLFSKHRFGNKTIFKHQSSDINKDLDCF